MRRRQPLIRLGFWILLPLLGLAFWWLASAATDRLLKQSNASAFEAQVTTTPPSKGVSLLSIKVDVYESKGISHVVLKSTRRDVSVQTLDIPSTAPEVIETKLAQRLNLPVTAIRQRVQYRERD